MSVVFRGSCVKSDKSLGDVCGATRISEKCPYQFYSVPFSIMAEQMLSSFLLLFFMLPCIM